MPKAVITTKRATLYVRLPDDVRAQLDAAVARVGQSVNEYVLRLLKREFARARNEFARARNARRRK